MQPETPESRTATILATLDRLYPADWAYLLIRVCGPSCDCHSPGKNPACAEGARWNYDAVRRWGPQGAHGTGTRESRLLFIANHIAAGGNCGLVLPPDTLALDLDSPEQMAAGHELLTGCAPIQKSSAGHGHALARTKPGSKVPGSVWIGGVATLTRVAGKAQIVCEPSRHVSGAEYRWMHPGLPAAGAEALPLLPTVQRAPGVTSAAGGRRPRDGVRVDFDVDFVARGELVPLGMRRDYVTHVAAREAAVCPDLEDPATAVEIETDVRRQFARYCESPEIVDDDSQFGQIVAWAVNRERESRAVRAAAAPQLSVVRDTTPTASDVPSEPAADEEPGEIQWADVKIVSDKDGNVIKIVPASTTANVEALLDHHGIGVRLNLMTDRIEVTWDGKRLDWSDELMTEVEDLGVRVSLPIQRIGRQVCALALERAYHPVRDWIESAPWDGRDRFGDVAAQLVVPDEATGLRDLLVTKWLVSVAGVLYRPGSATEGVLTLQGPQGCGKTTFFRSLIPLKHAVQDGLHLDPADKDSRMSATASTIVELGELESTLNRQLARIKAFLTLTEDSIRAPYARAAKVRPRQTVYGSFVNQAEFLRDNENRRFWVVALTEVRPAAIDMQQVFAQARAEVEQDGTWWLTPDERALLSEGQEAHRFGDPIADRLDASLRTDAEPCRWVTVTALLIEAGLERPTRSDVTRAGYALDRMGFEEKRRRAAARERWVPPHIVRFS